MFYFISSELIRKNTLVVLVVVVVLLYKAPVIFNHSINLFITTILASAASQSIPVALAYQYQAISAVAKTKLHVK